jgi:hypothetical protein
VDLNEIKQEHNALDNIVTDPVTGLVKVVEDLETSKEDTENKVTDFSVVDDVKFPTTQAVEKYLDAEVPEPNENQIIESGGIATIKTIFDRPSGVDVNFVINAIKGSPILPIYDNFTINESSLIDQNIFNKWVFYFSCNTEPAITSSPASYVTKTGTILTGYENLNKIELTLDYNVSGVLKVFMVITQMVDANLDPSPPISGDPDFIAFYNFEETEDLDIVLDASGYDHHATVVDSAQTDSTRVTGIEGNAIQINSNNSGSRYQCSDNEDINLAGNTPITFACWIWITTDDVTNNQTCGIFQKGGFRVTKQGAVTPANSFELRINGVSADRVRTGTITGGQWNFLAARFNGTTNLDIWLNNVKTSATITSTAIVDVAEPLQIVGLSTNSLRSGNRMDKARLWKRLLSDEEIEAIYDAEL